LCNVETFYWPHKEYHFLGDAPRHGVISRKSEKDWLSYRTVKGMTLAQRYGKTKTNK